MEFYHFNRQENEVFQILLYALKNNKTQVELPSTIDGDNLIRFYKYAISFSENPFISPYEIRYHYFNHRTYLQTVPLFPYLDRKKKMEFDKEFQYVVNGIQGIASTPYFQAKAAYLYLLQTVSYNSENPKVCHSAWGALMDGKAVCEGISYAYAFLLNKMRIPCGIVNGDCSLMGGAHAWNLLKLDGDYYHVDVTWGLTSDQGSRDNFNYFMLTDDEISCNHSWDKKYIPSCRSHRYNFFTQNDSYATSKIQLRKIMKHQLLNDSKIYLKLSHDIAKDYNQESLLLLAQDIMQETGKIFQRFSYTYEENLNIFRVDQIS